jgi:hypothetical protein
MKRFGSIGMAVCAAASALACAAAAHAAGDPPTGSVASWHSPAGPETMPLDVRADAAPDGPNLGQATVYLAGKPILSGDLCDPAQSCRSGEVSLALGTANYLDGTYDLRVTVADATGNARTVLDDPTFQIWNDRPTGSSTATLTVGSGVPQPEASRGGGSSGGVRGASARSCTKPKLSMVLDQRPLRIRHGVPVLVAGKRYRFTGRLTCVIDGRRVAAPKRTRIEVRALVHGRSVPKGRASVGAKGKIVIRLASPSSRTLEFRFTLPSGKATRVRIRIATVHVHVKKTKTHKKG